MTETQSKIMGALTVLSELDQLQVWEFIKNSFGQEESLTLDEHLAIKAYLSGDSVHQATIDFDSVKGRWL